MTRRQKAIVVSALEIYQSQTALAVRSANTADELTAASARYHEIGSVLTDLRSERADDV